MAFKMDEAESFARHHVEVWNTHDLERILDLYTPDVELWSPIAAEITGREVVTGRDGLREYFGAALTRTPELQFEIVDILRGSESVTIYMRSIGGRMVAEVLFVSEGRIAKVFAHYSTTAP